MTIASAPTARGVEMPQKGQPRIDRELIKLAKIRAVQEDITLTDWLENAIREGLKKQTKKGTRG
jgi:hypothetical protein